MVGYRNSTVWYNETKSLKKRWPKVGCIEEIALTLKDHYQPTVERFSSAFKNFRLRMIIQ
jgi:hypothetical protein